MDDKNIFSEGTELNLSGSVTVRKDGNDTPSDGFAVYHFDGEVRSFLCELFSDKHHMVRF